MQLATATHQECRWLHKDAQNAEGYSDTHLECRWLQPHTHRMQMATATHQKCRWIQPLPILQMATSTHLKCRWLQPHTQNADGYNRVATTCLFKFEQYTVLLTSFYAHYSLLCTSTQVYYWYTVYSTIYLRSLCRRPSCFSTEPEARNKTMGDQQHSHHITPTHNYP